MSSVAICTPCGDQVSAGFAMDLAKLVGHSASEHECVVLQVRGSILPQQRMTLVDMSLHLGADHLLWLDADMRFPKDALLRLLAHHQPIVAANYPTRRPPVVPVARDREHGHLFTHPTAIDCVPVDSVGMGCMLVERKVFETIPKPWFALGYNRQEDGWLGEDYFFCQQARSHGFQILIDQGLSHHVTHCGEIAWTHDHAEQTRQVYLERTGA